MELPKKVFNDKPKVNSHKVKPFSWVMCLKGFSVWLHHGRTESQRQPPNQYCIRIVRF